MSQRKIKAVHATERDDIGDLVTHRALPTHSLSHIDPFLFLNHHGPQNYKPGNRGLPFGPHPHRGFETVTFILEGSLAHEDSGGHQSVINEGGVQWMTAGRGLVHSEISPKDFMEKGGRLEILQLWVNLPSKLKMTQPRYVGLQREQIPLVKLNNEKVAAQLLSGNWNEERGAFKPLTDIELMTLFFNTGGSVSFSVPRERNVFFYVVRGELKVNSRPVQALHLVEFENNGIESATEIEIVATRDSVLVFGHAQPFGEPIVAHGPFVMNTKEEIIEAIHDYQAGKFKALT